VDVVPQARVVVEVREGPVDSAVGREVAHLVWQRGVFGDLVAQVEAGPGDHHAGVGEVASQRQRGLSCFVHGDCCVDVDVERIARIQRCAASAADCLHGARLWSTTYHDSPYTSLLRHQVHEEGACGRAEAVGKLYGC
jgi:hypothetical protein